MDSGFRVLIADLSRKTAHAEYFDARKRWLGGSGLAAALFEIYGDPCRGPFHPEQPLIFAVGPLTGAFPMMSKAVLGFLSPYHGQYAESHAGGGFALALRFSGFEALVVKGRAERLSCLAFDSSRTEIRDVRHLRGADALAAGRLLRRSADEGCSGASVLRIGPAGENRCAFAGINVDTYRHFGRLGAGAVMGGKNLKGIVAGGGGHLHLDPSLREAYSRMFDSLHSAVAEGKGAAGKYRDLGTARNLLPLNALQALPWRNLRDTSDQSAERLSGQRLAEERLLRRAACAGCPVGCIHIGMVGEQLGSKRDLPFRQVAYDFEPLFSLGTMLGMTDPAAVLGLLDEVERCGLDAISTGVALAWATEARERGIISQQETVDALRFGEPEPYLRAAGRLSRRENRFYSVLSRGTDAAARSYGGMDFACVLGQEMAGYATGEAFIAGQALGFRHSHLDSGGYRVDQTLAGGAEAAVQQLLEQEKDRVLLTCMVGCLFGREAYPAKILAAALQSLGYSLTEGELSRQAEEVRARRWRLRLAGGFEPEKVRIPERFLRIRNWKGSIDAEHLERIRRKYAAAIRRLAAREK